MNMTTPHTSNALEDVFDWLFSGDAKPSVRRPVTLALSFPPPEPFAYDPQADELTADELAGPEILAAGEEVPMDGGSEEENAATEQEAAGELTPCEGTVLDLATPPEAPMLEGEAETATLARARRVSTDDLAAVLGSGPMLRRAALAALQARGFRRSAAYAALSEAGRFAGCLVFGPGKVVSWKG